MQCEACGETISLSTAYRDDDGNFVCPGCHTNGQRQRATAATAEQRSRSGPDESTATAAAPARARQHRSEEGAAAPREASRLSPAGKAPEAKDGSTDAAPPQPAQQTFKTLLRFGKVLAFGGWVFVVLGGIGTLMGMGGLASAEESMMLGIAGAVLLPGSVLTLAQGLLLVVLGQQTSCFVAIERNTRSVFELLDAQDL